MLIGKRKVIHQGSPGSRVISVPAGMPAAEYATVAYGRLMLVDLKGLVSEEDLARILENIVDPYLHEKGLGKQT